MDSPYYEITKGKALAIWYVHYNEVSLHRDSSINFTIYNTGAKTVWISSVSSSRKPLWGSTLYHHIKEEYSFEGRPARLNNSCFMNLEGKKVALHKNGWKKTRAKYLKKKNLASKEAAIQNFRFSVSDWEKLVMTSHISKQISVFPRRCDWTRSQTKVLACHYNFTPI